jgi:hypothetical protein
MATETVIETATVDWLSADPRPSTFPLVAVAEDTRFELVRA